MNTTALDALFDKAGLDAALAHPTAKLWADVNHLDNFTLAIAGTIDHAIMGALNTDDSAHCEWINAYVKDAIPNWRPTYRGDYASPAYNNRVIRIAKQAYEQLRAKK